MSNLILTRRERIVQEVVRRLDSMQEGLPDSDPYRTTFGLVTRGSSLEQLHEASKAGASVVDTEETKDPAIQKVHCSLRLVVEFVTWVDGETPGGALNRVMGDVQRRMREDPHLTEPDDGRPLSERELAVDVRETGNQGFIDGFNDTKVSGAVFYTVRYVHAVDDPREYAGNRSS